jgi:hypothetical protein
MGRRTVDRFGERTDDDYEYCDRCGCVLLRSDSVLAGRCRECVLDEPVKRETRLADTRSARRRRKT